MRVVIPLGRVEVNTGKGGPPPFPPAEGPPEPGADGNPGGNGPWENGAEGKPVMSVVKPLGRTEVKTGKGEPPPIASVDWSWETVRVRVNPLVSVVISVSRGEPSGPKPGAVGKGGLPPPPPPEGRPAIVTVRVGRGEAPPFPPAEGPPRGGLAPPVSGLSCPVSIN